MTDEKKGTVIDIGNIMIGGWEGDGQRPDAYWTWDEIVVTLAVYSILGVGVFCIFFRVLPAVKSLLSH